MGWVCGTLEEMPLETFSCMAVVEGPRWPPHFSQNLLAAWRLAGVLGGLSPEPSHRRELGHGLTSIADPEPSAGHR